MRQFLLGLSISVAYIAGCLTSQHAPNIAVPDARGASVRYECVRLDQPIKGRAGEAEYATRVMNERVDQGWHFLAFLPDEIGIACFERDGMGG